VRVLVSFLSPSVNTENQRLFTMMYWAGKWAELILSLFEKRWIMLIRITMIRQSKA
jgi:hypothetical protein